ncbi:unnamed protein product [Blepharisma stoltei]|uniref:Uncharacterized protein n=1 Tax=Blepharisma stoltei TaxID=1481888 RepID=A0AAU9JAQ1_9CILI|nr:unnamed protein product [Blepharisma stoltei]
MMDRRANPLNSRQKLIIFKQSNETTDKIYVARPIVINLIYFFLKNIKLTAKKDVNQNEKNESFFEVIIEMWKLKINNFHFISLLI